MASPAVNSAGAVCSSSFQEPAANRRPSPSSLDSDSTTARCTSYSRDSSCATGLALDAHGYLTEHHCHEGLRPPRLPGGHRQHLRRGAGTSRRRTSLRRRTKPLRRQSAGAAWIARGRRNFVFAALGSSVAAYRAAFPAPTRKASTSPAPATSTATTAIRRHRPRSAAPPSTIADSAAPRASAVDIAGNLYVAASLKGRRGICPHLCPTKRPRWSSPAQASSASPSLPEAPPMSAPAPPFIIVI